MEPCKDFTPDKKPPEPPICSFHQKCDDCFYVGRCAAGRIVIERDALREDIAAIEAHQRGEFTPFGIMYQSQADRDDDIEDGDTEPLAVGFWISRYRSLCDSDIIDRCDTYTEACRKARALLAKLEAK